MANDYATSGLWRISVHISVSGTNCVPNVTKISSKKSKSEHEFYVPILDVGPTEVGGVVLEGPTLRPLVTGPIALSFLRSASSHPLPPVGDHDICSSGFGRRFKVSPPLVYASGRRPLGIITQEHLIRLVWLIHNSLSQTYLFLSFSEAV
jgi:hypothetical protein